MTFDHFTYSMTVDGKRTSISLWDTVSNEEYRRQIVASIICKDVFMLMYDVTSPSTFEALKETWLPMMTKHSPSSPFVLVGNKTDLRESQESTEQFVDPDSARAWAREVGAAGFFEVSAVAQETESLWDTTIRLGMVHSANHKSLEPPEYLKKCLRHLPSFPDTLG